MIIRKSEHVIILTFDTENDNCVCLCNCYTMSLQLCWIGNKVSVILQLSSQAFRQISSIVIADSDLLCYFMAFFCCFFPSFFFFFLLYNWQQMKVLLCNPGWHTSFVGAYNKRYIVMNGCSFFLFCFSWNKHYTLKWLAKYI